MEDNILKNINEIFTAKIRLGIMTLVSINEELDFSSLKKQLDISDGNLGAHLNVLEKAGYLEVKKEFVDRRPKTTYRVTKEGVKAFHEHLHELESIIKKIK
jgi:DNA-binding PadR family transcriptional regulator